MMSASRSVDLSEELPMRSTWQSVTVIAVAAALVTTVVAPAAQSAVECPPAHQFLNGRCLPSCRAAGGNACNDLAACQGLPRHRSWDCRICCTR